MAQALGPDSTKVNVWDEAPVSHPCPVGIEKASQKNVPLSPCVAGAGGEGLLVSVLSSSDSDEKSESLSDVVDVDGGLDYEAVESPEQIQALIESLLHPVGLEVYPFLIGWYNDKNGPKFQLDYPYDTLAYVITSGPDVFEKCIVPYVKARLEEDHNFYTAEPLDDSMRHAFTIVKEDLKSEGFDVDVFHDFDLHPSRRPKVLVQTAAHVAGAVQYLHKNNLSEKLQVERFSKKSNLNGVAIHPKYGGWYAIRGVIVLTNFSYKDLPRPEPLQIFNVNKYNQEDMAHVIELFAYNWQTNEWRNIHQGHGAKYSDNFLKYLDMDTGKRWEFIKTCLKEDEVNKNSGTISS